MNEIEICLACGKRHVGAVRGGKLTRFPVSCRITARGRSERGYRFKKCPCGAFVTGRHSTICEQWKRHIAETEKP